ncbi:hypothetical protein TNCV_2861161 [Trichonephila clavipes]|nr:hypothetical protein TNCV_2861161 [Trichonephila clavipes]
MFNSLEHVGPYSFAVLGYSDVDDGMAQQDILRGVILMIVDMYECGVDVMSKDRSNPITYLKILTTC